MAVKIRLQRKGRKKAPFYHIVIADNRAPRDGRFIEKIGTYNPLTVPATIELNRDRAYDWLTKGAQPTDTVNAILRFKGVLYRRHLAIGVEKGALTQEQADEKLATWIAEKDTRIANRKEASAEAKKQKAQAMDGTAKVKVKPVAPAPEPEFTEPESAGEPEHVEETPAPVTEPVAVAEEVVAAQVDAPVEAAEEVAAPVEEPAAAVEEVVAAAEPEAPAAEAPAAEEHTEES